MTKVKPRSVTVRAGVLDRKMSFSQRSVQTIDSDMELVDELVELWFPSLLDGDWSERWRTMTQIIEQIDDDLEDPEAASALSARVVERLLDRLGGAPIRCEAEALCHLLSASTAHQAAAEAWLSGARRLDITVERRAAPRRIVNRDGAISIDNRRLPCIVVDLSQSGALIECHGRIAIGSAVRVRAGTADPQTATVVRAHNNFYGVQFG